MNYESIQRLLDCDLCLSCLAHYLDVKIETIAVIQQQEDLLSECCRSMSRLLLNPRNGLSSEEARRQANITLQTKLRNKQSKTTNTLPFIDVDQKEICVNCFNVLHPVILDRLMKNIRQQVDGMLMDPTSSTSSSGSGNGNGNDSDDTVMTTEEEMIQIQLQFTIPAILDVCRVPTRTYVTHNVEKIVNFSTFDIILTQFLSILLPLRYKVQVTSDAKMIVSVKPMIQEQLAMTLAVYPDFKLKKPKRKFGIPNHNNSGSSSNSNTNSHSSTSATVVDGGGEEGNHEGMLFEEEDIPRMNIDKVLLWMKTLSKPTGICEMFQRYTNYLSQWSEQQYATRDSLMSFSTDCYYAPIYLFGRYCKFARDVPQSPWTITVESSAPTSSSSSNGGGGTAGNKRAADEDIPAATGGGGDDEEVRKGRGSIEEIIAYEIKQVSLASVVKLHACGREDIDVRCLGNGRPFALEVMYARKAFTSKTCLQQIARNINTYQGLNTQGDIRIIGNQMIAVDRVIWENMQSEAEEKKKGYSCVVYVQQGNVTREKLQALEVRSKNGEDVDDDGNVCLQIMQRTPLRVMHRRSLIDRTRFLYEIKTCMINEHYFLMNLVTSAGAYVKEFVHGDMGRTRPSISGWFDSPAEILQLDVTWLYDDFQKYSITTDESNDKAVYEADMLQVNAVSKDVELDEEEKKASWDWLNSRRLATRVSRR